MPHQDSTDRRLSLFVLVCSAILLLVTSGQILCGRVFTLGDMGAFNIPARAFYQQALQRHVSFLWMPQMFCGYYLFAEGQVGMLHPSHLLLYRFLPLTTAVNMESILSFVWMYAGSFLMMRRFGFPNCAALSGAMSFTFCGSNLMHYQHLSAISVVSHLPWLIYCLDIAIRTVERRSLAAALAGISGLIGSQLLLGHPNYFWCSTLTAALYALWTMAKARSFGRAPHIVAAAMIGVLIGAVQLAPTLDLAKHSVRDQVDFDFRMSFSSHPANLISLVSPYALKNQYWDGGRLANKYEVNFYDGILSTLCLIWCAIRRRQLSEWRDLLQAAAILAVVMLLFTLGYYGLLYRAVSYLPPFSAFRCPCRYDLIMHLALSVFVAAATADLVRTISGGVDAATQPKLRVLFVPAVLSAVATLAVFTIRQLHCGTLASRLATGREFLCGFALVLSGTLFFYLASRRRLCALYALFVLTVFDLSLHWWTSYSGVRQPQSISSWLTKDVATPPDSGTGRLLTGQGKDGAAPLDLALKTGRPLATGDAALFPARRIPFLDNGLRYRPDDQTAARRLAGISYERPLKPDGTSDQSKWVAGPDPLPRARFVSKVVVSANIPADLPTANITTTALVDSLVKTELAAPGTALIADDRPGHLEIMTTTKARQLLVLSESYYPGWNVSLDGATALPDIPVYGDYQGCVVPAGNHRIVFDFAPASFEIGKRLTVLGVVLTVVFYLGIISSSGSQFRRPR